MAGGNAKGSYSGERARQAKEKPAFFKKADSGKRETEVHFKVQKDKRQPRDLWESEGEGPDPGIHKCATLVLRGKKK